MNKKSVKLFLIKLAIVIIMIYIIGIIYRYSHKSNIILILNLILIAYAINIYLKAIHIEIEYKSKGKEMEQLKGYIAMLETSNLDMRKFKHDYLNILSTINDYILNSDFEGFVKYFNESIIPHSKEIKCKNLSFNNLKNIKLSAIKGILYYKIVQAQQLDINISVEVLDEIEDININIVDLCRIIGILLDNAIEEVVMCESKIIKINIIKCKKAKIFVISNTCRDNLPSIYNMIQRGFSTKGDNRGLGLSNIQEIIYGQYENINLNTYIEDEIFKQELIIED